MLAAKVLMIQFRCTGSYGSPMPTYITIFCYMTPIKDLLRLAETGFHQLLLILMSTVDQLTSVQDWSTSVFVSAARELNRLN